jgi:hypothetical protein
VIKALLEYDFYDKIKLNDRSGKHAVSFYRLVRGNPDNGSSLQVTSQVAHFLLHVQGSFVMGRDKLYISTTPSSSEMLVVDYVYVVVRGKRKDMLSQRASDKPLVYLTGYDLTLEEASVKAGYEVYFSESVPLEKRMEQIECCSLMVANLDVQRLMLTLFDMGYAHGAHKRILVYTKSNEMGSHVLESVIAVVKTPEELQDALQMYYPIASPLTSPTFRATEVLGAIQAKYKQHEGAVR